MEDPYKVLGVSPDATDDEIKRAYRALSKKYHPDLNPDDPVAAKKMQQINAAYDQIKNPASRSRQQYDPYGGYQQRQSTGGDDYQRSAYQYLRFGRYREALNVLQSCAQRDARWYYLSALANDGLGDEDTALEHIRRAVSMEPDNMEYLSALEQIENGGAAYRRQAGNYGGFTFGGNPCMNMCLCYLVQMICCGGRPVFFCC